MYYATFKFSYHGCLLRALSNCISNIQFLKSMWKGMGKMETISFTYLHFSAGCLKAFPSGHRLHLKPLNEYFWSLCPVKAPCLLSSKDEGLKAPGLPSIFVTFPNVCKVRGYFRTNILVGHSCHQPENVLCTFLSLLLNTLSYCADFFSIDRKCKTDKSW